MNMKDKLYWEAFRTVFATKMMFWNGIVLPIGILMIWYRHGFVAHTYFVVMWACTVTAVAYLFTAKTVSDVDTSYELKTLARKAREWCWYMTTPYLLILFVISPPAMLIFGASGMFLAWANTRQNRATE